MYFDKNITIYLHIYFVYIVVLIKYIYKLFVCIRTKPNLKSKKHLNCFLYYLYKIITIIFDKYIEKYNKYTFLKYSKNLKYYVRTFFYEMGMFIF